MMKQKKQARAEISKEELEKERKHKTIKAYFLVTFGTLLYSLGVVWILQLGSFFSGGVTGLSQLIIALFNKFVRAGDFNTFLSNNIGTLVMLINIPLLLFGWKSISKRFAVLTIVSIIIQTIAMNLLSTYTISPFVNLLNDGKGLGEGLIEAIQTGKLQVLKTPANIEQTKLFMDNMSVGTRLMLAMFGGVVCGVGGAMCLKSGGSTGGLDIISNYLQVKKHIPFTKVQATVDGTVILTSCLISVENVLFTLIRLFVYIYVVDRLYKIYKTDRIEVVTTKGTELRTVLMKRFSHSLTTIECVGGYTQDHRQLMIIYVSVFEFNDYIEVIKEIDPLAFITKSKAKIEKSIYNQQTII